MSNKFLFWSKIIDRIVNIRSAYADIKNNPESKPVSTLLGKKATKYNILFLVMIGLAIASVVGAGNFIANAGIFIAVLLIALAVLFAIMSVVEFVFALMCSIYQLKLNKKPIGFVNLIISILIIVLTVVSIILIVKK